MSTIDFIGIIEAYIPPGLKAYQIEAGRVDLTDYLDELQVRLLKKQKKWVFKKRSY